jgi:tRNA nucleotidyltransferase (CCA-adding enzyme)
VYFLALTGGLNKKELEEVADKFKFSMDVRETILLSCKSPVILRALNKKGLKPGNIYKVLRSLPMELLLFMMVKYRKTRLEKYIGLYITKLSHVKLKINGDKLKELGFTPGPVFRNMLNSTLTAKLNGEIKDTPDDEIRYVKRHWKTGGNINE